MNNIQINFLKPENEQANTPPAEPKKTLNKKKIIVYFLVLFLVIFLGGCLAKKMALRNLPDDPNAYEAGTLKPKKTGILQTVKNFIFAPENILQGENDNRINILLLGMGGAGHDGPYLTDTNIILSIQPETKEAAMISIPRDLGVKLDGYGWRKINSANAFGEVKQKGYGGEYARQVFEDTLNIDIPYYIRLDFTAFKEMIDAVGGVNINVINPFIDYEYPGPNYSYQTLIFKAGEQIMDGETALKYSRSRHGSNGESSDFARSRRQQQIITALKEKMLSSNTYTNPLKLKSIYDSLSNHLTTNLNFGQIMYLGAMAKEIDLSKLKTLVIDNGENGYLNASTENGSWLLMPKTGNFDEISDAIENIFNPNYEFKKMDIVPQSNSLPSAKIEIQNGTWQVGLAGKVAKKLEEAGFGIAEVGNSSKRPIATTTIYLINQGASTAIVKALETELKTTIATATPDWLQYEYDDEETTADETGAKFNSSTEILIILGENSQ